MATEKAKSKKTSLHISEQKIIKQTTRECQMLEQETVDDYIAKMLQIGFCRKTSFSDVISVETFILICHKVLEVFKRSNTLEYVHDPDGMAIVGDLHGSYVDLLRTFKDTGWPNERTIIFLGDYIDRGPQPLEVIILLFLLKIRYQQRVFMLRGNHETFDQCCHNNHDSLIQQIRRKYPDRDVDDLLFYNLVHVFDYLPLAAIISDQILCCHGGISQFAKCRADITSIKRPLKWTAPTTNVLHVTILTDTLWADPRNQGPRYVPSERHTSYYFNKQALIEKLRQFNCRALIRGHESTKGGFRSELGGLCFTVHTSRPPGCPIFMAGKIILNFNKTTKLLEGYPKYHRADDSASLKNLSKELAKKFREIKYMYPMNLDAPMECSSCKYFMAGIDKNTFIWERTLHHGDFLNIIKEYQGSELDPFDPEFYDSCDEQTEKQLFLAARKFPQLLETLIEKDMIPMSGDTVLDANTRPDYDFMFKLPPTEEGYTWPLLKISK